MSEIQRIEEDIINLKRKFYAREEKVKQGNIGNPENKDEREASSPLRRPNRNNMMETLEKLR